MGRHQSYGFDVCGSTECQAYHGCGDGRSNSGPSEVSDQAVEETAGQVVLYNGKLAETVYSSSAAGATEDAKNDLGDGYSQHPSLPEGCDRSLRIPSRRLKSLFSLDGYLYLRGADQ